MNGTAIHVSNNSLGAMKRIPVADDGNSEIHQALTP